MGFLHRVVFFVFTIVLLFSPASAKAQDSIPPAVSVDTTLMDTLVPSTVDTIVIREVQNKIKIIPRGVNLANPVITFSGIDPFTRVPKKFVVPSFWQKINRLSFILNEVAFINWNAGGDNSISALGKLDFERNYKFRYINWDNVMALRYGWNSQEGREVRKTEDAIRLRSTFGIRRDTLSPWYYSVKGKFNTQFTDGFKYPDRSTPISRFMAPGYLFLGAGVSFIPEGKNFDVYISPASFKTTFVLDEELANSGAFGVKKAILDPDGNVVVAGEQTFSEFGVLITNYWEKEILKNVILTHALSLYTDYLKSFGNIDVDWELNFRFTVNDFIEATFGTHIIYDDDIKFDRVVADDGTVVNPGGARVQFKQILGIGLIYDF
ncbi:MAG: DUF3078 domain-containing protein [Flavobacteriaceae bacterium]